MANSKTLVIKHLQARVDAGYNKREIAAHLGFPNPNYVSMLMRANYPKCLLSLNRMKVFAAFCELTPAETLQLVLARLADAGESPVEMSKRTMLWLFRVFGQLLKLRVSAKGAC